MAFKNIKWKKVVTTWHANSLEEIEWIADKGGFVISKHRVTDIQQNGKIGTWSGLHLRRGGQDLFAKKNLASAKKYANALLRSEQPILIFD